MGLMKKQSLLLSLLLTTNIFSNSGIAAEKKEVEVEPAPIVLNDSLKKMLEIKGVDTIYKGCNVDYTQGNSLTRSENVLNCVWEAVKNDKSLAKKVKEAYSDELKNEKVAVIKAEKSEKDSGAPNNSISAATNRSPASDKVSLTDKKLNVQENYSADPAIQALSAFYAKKLDEIMDPNKALTKEELKNGTILAVDHNKFIELYKTELGRTIVSAFTSYCLDADVDNDGEIKTGMREKNLKEIASADLTTGSKASNKWLKCIVNVSTQCKNTSTNNGADIKTELAGASETSKRACLVVDYVEAARRNLIVADRQIEDYKLLDARNSIGIVQNAKHNTDLKKTSNDNLLEMTSADVKDALKDPMDKEILAFKQCYDDVKKEIVNIDACKKYLSTNKDANIAALVDMGMRKIAQEETLKEELNSSDDRVRDYLVEEGYSKDDAKEMTKNPTSVTDVKKDIIARYAAQKAAIIKEMASKIENKTTTNEGKIDKVADKSKLIVIGDELNKRSEDLQNLVKFNNIVSSYLKVEDPNKKDAPSRNTASLFAEVKSLDEKDGKVLKDNLRNSKLVDQKGKASGTDLSVDTLNKNFINYDSQPKP